MHGSSLNFRLNTNTEEDKGPFLEENPHLHQPGIAQAHQSKQPF